MPPTDAPSQSQSGINCTIVMDDEPTQDAGARARAVVIFERATRSALGCRRVPSATD
jgi:hypothetical protein